MFEVWHAKITPPKHIYNFEFGKLRDRKFISRLVFKDFCNYLNHSKGLRNSVLDMNDDELQGLFLLWWFGLMPQKQGHEQIAIDFQDE